jgi:hypothetical protein
MTESEMKPKTKKLSDCVKVEFTKENSELFKTLLDQANAEMRGASLNFTKFGNWLLSQHGPALSEDEKMSLKSAFHSEKAYAKWMVEEIERAEIEGRVPPTILELLSQKPDPKPIKKIPRIKKVSKVKTDLPVDLISGADSAKGEALDLLKVDPTPGQV